MKLYGSSFQGSPVSPSWQQIQKHPEQAKALTSDIAHQENWANPENSIKASSCLTCTYPTQCYEQPKGHHPHY